MQRLPLLRLPSPLRLCGIMILTTVVSSVSLRLNAGESVSVADVPDVVEFNRDVRPILSDNCFQCHGPDRNKREADLRLDTPEGLLGGDENSGVVTPGSVDDSELFRRLITDDPDEHMPPAETNKVLSPRDIEVLRRWISQGAEYEGHWSFLPLREFPDGSLPDSVSSDSDAIDHFVDQKLQEHGLSRSHVADRVTLLRRLHFDVTGLPPTPEEVETFCADDSPNAWENKVDELLASPHFGERMAMWWLDLVRFADTVGYHGDQEMSVSPFRDYVIRSFNENRRFDEFTVEQLAGDLLPAPGQEQLIASGYNRLGMMSAEGGVQDREYLAKYIAERVRNVSGTWLGVTMGCCECHDHKFDPFTTREFYEMEAFFADIRERGLYSGANSDGNWGPSVKVPTTEQREQRQQLQAQVADAESRLNQSTPQLVEAQAAWEQSLPVWQPLRPIDAQSREGVTLTVLDDHSVLASGADPSTDTFTLTVPDAPAGITALRLEVLPDDSLPQKGPGRAGNGNFVLTEFVVRAGSADHEPRSLNIASAAASYEQTGAAGKHPYGKWAIAAAIDHDEKGKNWGWAIMEQVGTPQAAVFVLAADSSIAEGETLTVELQQNHDNPSHTIGRFRISATTSPKPGAGDFFVPQEIAAIVAVPQGNRSEDQSSQLAAYYRSLAPELEPVRQELAALQKQQANLEKAITTSLITEAVEPRMIRVLPRGNWMADDGDVVLPGFPSALQVTSVEFPADRRLTRLDLARWITAPDNPLAARVFVNRIWKLYFGAGLSRKLDDVGAQGEPPTHPLLLDYLAGRFVQSGWDVKRLIRTILLSQTWQQSSLADQSVVDADPYNHWLARQGRFRLDAELVRDNALAISGLLVREVGGQSVKPYQPAGYWAYLNFPTREWQNGTGGDLYRRGLYTHWQRQYLHPSLMAFDAPSREECTADRARSNTPLQSLALLNDPTYVEAARAFAERIVADGGQTTRDRLDFAFRRALSRPVLDNEATVLTELLQRASDEYRAQPDLAGQLLTVGAAPVGEGLDPVELAAWTTAARAILNLHETITRN